MLSTSAFNALLKTVEEPPALRGIHLRHHGNPQGAGHHPLAVASSSPSGCSPRDEIRDRLVEVATELNLETDDEALIWIAKEADGSLRDAYTTFDQVASFAGERRISIDAIRDTIGALSMEELNRVGTLIGQR